MEIGGIAGLVAITTVVAFNDVAKMETAWLAIGAPRYHLPRF